jgi:hypothetical protein
MERRLAPRYEYALQTLREIPYGRWRQYDGEDALHFYALRLHEAGLIKSSPQQIRPGYRLAVFQRAEEGTEGIVGRADAAQLSDHATGIR